MARAKVVAQSKAGSNDLEVMGMGFLLGLADSRCGFCNAVTVREGKWGIHGFGMKGTGDGIRGKEGGMRSGRR